MKKYKSPHLLVVVAVFVLIGPFIWPFAFFAVHALFSTSSSLPSAGPFSMASLFIVPLFMPLFGGYNWWSIAFTANGFAITILPTLIAGLIFGAALTQLGVADQFDSGSRKRWICACACISAVISAFTFVIISAGAAEHPLSSQGIWLLPTVLIVAIVGGLLGALVGVMSKQVDDPST
jgi:hypothetical protein